MSADTQPRPRFRVTRRGVLIGTAAAGTALVVGAFVGRNAFYRIVAGFLAEGTMPGGGETDPAVWFELDAGGRVRLVVPKVEMGQGAHTALAQIAADELGAAWSQVDVVQGGTSLGPDDANGTVGSASVSGLYVPLRTAAATLRGMLADRAAALLGVDASALTVADGAVRAGGSGATLSFGEIVAATDVWAAPAREPALKSPLDFTLIGRPMPRVDLDAKIRGQAVYGFDLRSDGMLYGAVARPPKIGATMLTAAAGDAAAHPGVVDVVVDAGAGFAGVVARTRRQAHDAAAKLDVTWRTDVDWTQAMIDDLLDVSAGAGVPIQRTGDGARALGNAPTLTAEYSSPFAVHAQLEPQAALAEPRGAGVRITVSTQMAGFARGAAASALGIDEADVEVTPAYLGGGFGRKTGVEPAIEAARLARATGRPVHVGWTREEDMRHGFFRPPTRSRFAATLARGRIHALAHWHSSGEVLFGFLPRALGLLVGPDPGAWRGAYSFYDGIEHRLLSTHTARLPVPTGAWRGLGLFANTFAVESFVDEAAHAAGADPLDFRLAHLGDGETGRRLRAVLETAAARAGYGDPLPAGRAHGIACCVDVGTAVAMVVELSVDDGGRIAVHRATQSIDAGLIVNPDGALAQAQGSIVMGLGSTLLEEARVENGAMAARNFDGYPLLTMDRAPELDIRFVASERPPSGMGEPAIGPVAAAVGNAVFNLTGARLRRLPLTPARVVA